MKDKDFNADMKQLKKVCMDAYKLTYELKQKYSKNAFAAMENFLEDDDDVIAMTKEMPL